METRLFYKKAKFFLEKRLIFGSSADVDGGDLVQASDHNNLRSDLNADHHADPSGTKITNASISATAAIEAKKILLQGAPTMLEYLFDGGQATNVIPPEMELIKAGYLVGISAVYSDSISSGSITIEPTKNGTAFTPTDLDITLNSSNQRDAKVISYATSGYDFAAGDRVGVRINSSSLNPATGTLKIILYFHNT